MTFPNHPDEGVARSARASLIGPIVVGQNAAATPAAVQHQPIPPLFVRPAAAAVEPDEARPVSPRAGERGSASQWMTQSPPDDFDGGEVSSSDVLAGEDPSEWLTGSGGVEATAVGGEEGETKIDEWTSLPGADEEGQVNAPDGYGDTWDWAESVASASETKDHSEGLNGVEANSVSDAQAGGNAGVWDDGYEASPPAPLADVFGSDASEDRSSPAGYAPPSEEVVASGSERSTAPEVEPSFSQPVEHGRKLSNEESADASEQDQGEEPTEGVDAVLTDSQGWDAFTPAPFEPTSGGVKDRASVWQDDASGTGYGRSDDEALDELTGPSANGETDSEQTFDQTPAFADQTAASVDAAERDGGVAEQLPGEPSTPDPFQNAWESADDLSAVEAAAEPLTDYTSADDEADEASADWYASAVIMPEPDDPTSRPPVDPDEEASDVGSADRIPPSPSHQPDPRASVLAARLERIADALRSGGATGVLADAGKDPLAPLIAGYLLGMAETTETGSRTEAE